MRVTRGLFASLGASGCIAAAGACALLAVSMAVGFRGWPGLSATPVSSGTITGSAVRTAAHRRLSIVPAGSPRRVLAATEAPSSDMPRTPGATGGARAVTHARPTPHGAAGTPAGAGAAAAGAPTGTDAPAGAGETVRR